MLNQNKGKFPANTGKDLSKRCAPPANPKGYSSLEQNKGVFPVKTSKDQGKRFKPPSP